MIGLGKGLEVIQEIGISTTVETRTEVEIGDKGLGLIQGIETGKVGPEQNQGLDPVPIFAPIEIDLGDIDAVNMITLQRNAPMLQMKLKVINFQNLKTFRFKSELCAKVGENMT